MYFNRRVGPVVFNQRDLIGQGNAGNVYKGKLINSYNKSIDQKQGQEVQVAIKIISLCSAFQNQVTAYLFNSQKMALNLLKNDYIIKSYGIFQDNIYSYIITQFISGGTLKQYIQAQIDSKIQINKEKVSQNIALDITCKLLKALKIIWQNGFVHRDLKPANIMLKKKQNSQFLDPVIIDFGFTQNLNAFKKPSIFYNVGSPSYMAPQSFNFTKYSEKSDLWSIGVMLYQMISGESLDKDLLINQYFLSLQTIVKQKIDKICNDSSKNLCKILERMLNQNQNQRGTIDQVIELIQKQLNLIKKSFFCLKNRRLSKENLIKQEQNQNVQIRQQRPPMFKAKTFFSKNSQNQPTNLIKNQRYNFSRFFSKKCNSNFQLKTNSFFSRSQNQMKQNKYFYSKYNHNQQKLNYQNTNKLNPQTKQRQQSINTNHMRTNNSSLSKSKVQFHYFQNKIPRVMSQSFFYLKVK